MAVDDGDPVFTACVPLPQIGRQISRLIKHTLKMGQLCSHCCLLSHFCLNTRNRRAHPKKCPGLAWHLSVVCSKSSDDDPLKVSKRWVHTTQQHSSKLRTSSSCDVFHPRPAAAATPQGQVLYKVTSQTKHMLPLGCLELTHTSCTRTPLLHCMCSMLWGTAAANHQTGGAAIRRRWKAAAGTTRGH